MTDTVLNGMSQNQTAIPMDGALPQSSSTAEKMIPQSVFDNAIKHEKHQAREQARKEAFEEIQRQQQAQPSSQMTTQNMGGSQESMEAMARRVANEEKAKWQADHEQAQRNAQGMQIANTFAEKVKAAKEKYPDSFDENIAPIVKDMVSNPGDMANLIHMLQGLPNSEDVLHEMGKNRQKFVSLITSSQYAPHTAMSDLQALSNSIKTNQEAQKQPSVNEPLSQLKPSNVGKDNGSMTVHDFKNQDWLKG